MKKTLIFSLSILSILFLSACSQNPFTALPDTELEYNNTISFDYYNGKTTNELFEYSFSHEYYYFVGLLDGNYRFTAINNYLEISNDFIAFLEFYDDNIIYDKFINDSYGDDLRLSLGATNGDFNLSKISIDDEVYDVDAYMSIDNGLRIVFSYTEFYHEGQLVIVPYYLSVVAYDIHEAYLKEYLPENNEYVSEKAILTKYVTHIIPLPPKVSRVTSTFDQKDDLLKDLGYYMRIVEDSSNNPSQIKEVCTATVTENCFESEFSSLSGIIYDYSISEIISFYEQNYAGTNILGDFVFLINDEYYKITLENTTIESTTADSIIENIYVVAFEITIYDN